MPHTPDGQVGAKVGAPPLYCDLVVPIGLTFADLYEAAKYVWDYDLDEADDMGDERWLGLSEQFFRFDKWSTCRG